MMCDIFYVTRTVWGVGQAEGRGVNLPKLACMKKNANRSWRFVINLNQNDQPDVVSISFNYSPSQLPGPLSVSVMSE